MVGRAPVPGCDDAAGNTDGFMGKPAEFAGAGLGTALTAGAGKYLLSAFFGRQAPVAKTIIATADINKILFISINF